MCLDFTNSHINYRSISLTCFYAENTCPLSTALFHTIDTINWRLSFEAVNVTDVFKEVKVTVMTYRLIDEPITDRQ